MDLLVNDLIATNAGRFKPAVPWVHWCVFTCFFDV
jgi:hypothetical protein